MPDVQPSLLHMPAEPVLTTKRAAALVQAHLVLRLMAGDLTARNQRQPDCLYAVLADALEAIAEGSPDAARQALREWGRTQV